MFKKATKEGLPLKMALLGPAGSGKSMSSLKIAHCLADGGRIAAIDTERGSLSKYSDMFDFDVIAPDSFAVSVFIEGINAAVRGGYKALIIDSLSHAWAGPGGILEFKDEVTRKSRSGNSFDAWRTVTPEHNRLVDALCACPIHLIVTMRTKTEYVIEENERGKKAPRKIGMQPVQRDGLEYEFDVVGDMDAGILTISKTRCAALDGKQFRHPGSEIAGILREWLGDTPAPTLPAPEPEVPAAAAPPELSDAMVFFRDTCLACGLNPKEEMGAFATNKGVHWSQLMDAQILSQAKAIKARHAQAKQEASA